MRRWFIFLTAALGLSALVLIAFPSPTIAYEAVVVFHIVGGAVLLALTFPALKRLLSKTSMLEFLKPILDGRREELSPVLLDFLSIAHREPPLTGEELLQAWAECDQVRGQLLSEMQDFPILICPVCSIPAFRHGQRSWSVDGGQVAYLDAMLYTQWFNLLGSPAAGVPVGRSPEGLPIGVQIAGLPFQDEVVLAITNCIDKEFGFIAPSVLDTPSANMHE